MTEASELERLREENRALRAENERLRQEAEQMEERLCAVAGQVENLRTTQETLMENVRVSEGMLRWLRARLDVVEREIDR